MNVIKEINSINNKELELGIYGGSGKGSWHDKYRDSAWIYFGGLPFDLSEGDIICVLSQWGEIEDINLVRDKVTNKSMGFAFVKYEDQRSTILAVDNFNGIKLLGRTLRCDHVERYKLPKNIREKEEEALEENPDRDVEIGPGHAYSEKELVNDFNILNGQDVWADTSQKKSRRKSSQFKSLEQDDLEFENSRKKHKKSKHKKKKDDDSDSDKKNQRKNSHEKKHLPIDLDIKPSIGSKSKSSDQKGTKDISEFDREMERSAKILFDQQITPSGSTGITASGALASWRGRRDPTVASALDLEKRIQLQAQSGTEMPKRGEFEGFGGMNRRR